MTRVTALPTGAAQSGRLVVSLGMAVLLALSLLLLL